MEIKLKQKDKVERGKAEREDKEEKQVELEGQK